MRIAVLLSEFPNLSETFVLDQITGLVERGHELDIYADRCGNMSAVHADIERYRLLERTNYWGVSRSPLRRAIKGAGLLVSTGLRMPCVALRSVSRRRYGPPAAALVVLHAAARLTSKRSYDVVHCHFGPTGLVGTALRDLGRIEGRIATSFYGYDLTSYPRRHGREVFAPLLARGDLFLPLCGVFRDHLLNLDCDPRRIRIHHIGVDCTRFQFAPRTPPPDGQVQLITVARLAEKKGLSYGIQAVARLLAKCPKLRYVIVGTGPLRGALQSQIDALGVGQSITLAGPRNRDDIARMLADAHLFVAPSVTASDGDQEGTPTALMEAAAVGLPVVSTLHSGIPEIVAEGVSGYLVPEREVGALAERVEHLLDHPELWPNFGRAGREIIEQQFNIRTLNDELEGLFTGLCPPREPATA